MSRIVSMPVSPAASSIASGMPSSRAQISKTVAAVDRSSSNPDLISRVRSRKRRIASLCSKSSGCPASSGRGRLSDGVRQISSPGTPSGSRLVTSSVRFGHERSSRLASVALSSTMCSVLSRMTIVRSGASVVAMTSPTGRSASSRIPQAEATVWSSSRASVTLDSSTSHTPSG